ncbi:MAG: thiaminase II [Thermoleophilaceae bacterium]
MKGLADRLRASASDVWEAQHLHPFATGIGDGSLPLEPFQVWLRQDWLFLIEYARLLALGAARAPDLDTMTRLAGLTRAILEDEMSLHRSYAAEFGISAAELDAERMLPTTQGYTDFLVRTAATGDFAELVAALLPCMWGYSEVGTRLAERDRPPAGSRYAAWIEMYASEEFAELAAWCRTLTERVGERADHDRMQRAFLTSSRYELAFWEMAWAGESWPR